VHCPEWRDRPATEEWKKLAAQVEQEACTHARDRRVGHRDVGRWHRKMFESEVPLPCYAGGLRQPRNAAVHPCLSQDVEVGGRAGAPHQIALEQTKALLADTHTKLRQLDRDWSDLDEMERVRRTAELIGTAVGRFIQIHPFINGNGRTSRLLWRVFLQRLGLPVQFGIVPRPAPPYAQAMSDAMRGDYAAAVALVLQGLANRPPEEGKG
jgi:fido (protein-threonine AMPylation protein)